MSDPYAKSDAAGKAFDENTLSDCDDKTLQEHLIAFAKEDVPNPALQHRNIIRGITINHILFQRHIERLNTQNEKTQKLVIALTVAALLVGVPQIWFSYKADKRAETDLETKSMPQLEGKSQMLIPNPSQPPAKHPVLPPAKDARSISRTP